ncbi:MAG: TIGR03617 family F420-dependent LLM class oxidoreductase [Nitrospinae bacterium]|nr:TIGR03617 family F420-dependent LLM class oxidoreductase [Nitrospinota bacterium]
MRILTDLPMDDLNKVGPAARAIEAAGYDGAMTMEHASHPFLPLAIAAVETRRVELLTAVAIAFPRSPMVCAYAAWDLQVASNGRFVLGLGSQVRAHNERRFSVPWSAPVARMREYVESLRALWRAWRSGEKLDYRGEHYRFSLLTPPFTPSGNDRPMTPVTIAAVGPGMLRVAGSRCDGVRLHPFCTSRYFEEFCLPRLLEGLEENGITREQFEITGGGYIVTGRDEEAIRRGMDEVKMRLGYLGSTPNYWPVLEMHGYGELGRRLRLMAVQGKWGELAGEIPDDLVHLFAAVGVHGEIKAAIEARFANGVDTLYAGILPTADRDLPPDLIQDIQTIPVAFTGFAER